ncbi:sulfite exporter TauE/SafE family protein [Bacillus carboniphilus]|uniref:Probable membrane transporter protein n=1 Tax=Bacillus carboniphilus TaxID=86663 RepID=A0ABY9JXN1_9BACI|nr:sulfite exporter TauE/SafE family protein [Bacillus carboniphilus]WLR43200.1 sulfite exporter TauE/SafE family protein [Bacillus carboniphilus]
MIWSLFFLGIIVSFVGTLAGGGGLIGMPVMLLLGFPVHSAIAANKFSNTISSLSSFTYLLKNERIQANKLVMIAPIATFGGIMGGLLTTMISPERMNYIALIFLLAAVTIQLYKELVTTTVKGIPFDKKHLLSIFGISTYDGMFGPGQATLLMISYLKVGVTYLKAITYTRFQTLLSCLSSFTIYLLAGTVNWSMALSLSCGTLIGAQISVRVADKISSNRIKWILQLMTIILILNVLYSIFK